jgi:hypothetical protein
LLFFGAIQEGVFLIDAIKAWLKREQTIAHVVIGLSSLAYLWLIWASEYLIMQDLAGHVEIAFLHVQVNSGNPIWTDLYQMHSQPWPNSLAIVLLGELGRLFGYWTAAKLLLSVCILAWPLGVLFLARSLGRSPYLALLSLTALLDFNWAYGFFNYLLAKPCFLLCLGLAIRFVKADGAKLHTWLGVALTASLALTYLFHSMVWVYSMAACAWAVLCFGSGWDRVKRQWPLLVCITIAIPFVVSRLGQPPGTGQIVWNGLGNGLSQLWECLGLLNKGITDELAYAIPFICWMVLLFLAGRVRDATEKRRSVFLLVLLAGIMGLYFFGPLHLPDVAVIVVRQLVFAWVLLLMLPAVQVKTLLRRLVLAGAILLGVGIQVAGTHWHYDKFSEYEMGDFRALSEHLPRGSRLATSFVWNDSSYGVNRAGWHWPKLLAVWREGHTDDSFAHRRYTYVTLTETARARGLTTSYDLNPARLEKWDYLLVRMRNRHLKKRVGKHLTEITRTGLWVLYRVEKNGSPAVNPAAANPAT